MPSEKPCIDVWLVLKPHTNKAQRGYVLEAYDALQTEATLPRTSANLSSLDFSGWAKALPSIFDGDSRGMQQMGDYLAKWLFLNQRVTTLNTVGTYLQERSAQIKRPQPLRVWMRLDCTLPGQYAFRSGFIPLECLEHSGILPVRVLRGVVSGASTSQPFVRLSESLEVAERLRVLLVYANPAEDKAPTGSEYPHLPELHRHFNVLSSTLDPLSTPEALFIRVLPSPPPEQLRETLTRFNPHVLVFIGHGYCTDGGGLVCVRNGAPEKWAFSELVEAIQEIQGPNLRLVVFMACRSFIAAPSLLTVGVPAVIAMQPLADIDFPEQSVRVFAESFFRVLAYLGPISEAYLNACQALLKSEMPFAALMPTLWLATTQDTLFASPEKRLRARYLDALWGKLDVPLQPSPDVESKAGFAMVYMDKTSE